MTFDNVNTIFGRCQRCQPASDGIQPAAGSDSPPTGERAPADTPLTHARVAYSQNRTPQALRPGTHFDRKIDAEQRRAPSKRPAPTQPSAHGAARTERASGLCRGVTRRRIHLYVPCSFLKLALTRNARTRTGQTPAAITPTWQSARTRRSCRQAAPASIAMRTTPPRWLTSEPTEQCEFIIHKCALRSYNRPSTRHSNRLPTREPPP